jgi:hypothetical protein
MKIFKKLLMQMLRERGIEDRGGFFRKIKNTKTLRLGRICRERERETV